ncbi:hypothetical protein CYLTODRAFT_376282 [Cylindrobasidium torrendii FP15055 ss-10]|uniref:holo-[acyl-carrier-protein] synthase n=1 Tax=Cylindrobasidium torrendii FP15055 ss-10 TaxID=1314674 RepID=A0A0D7BB13_9AGAR|nr:hypothetical protein CYLTODRAFT_376282 [Cylindrobasidium torrendii FP15055 ss-10]
MTIIKARIVRYVPQDFTDQLYEAGLSKLDEGTVAQIKKFYRREDAVRGLISKLLPRRILREHGIDPSTAVFDKTPANKPFLLSPQLDPPLAYNISHDNGLVGIVYGPGINDAPAFQLGIDLMKVRIPGNDTFETFIGYMDSQLTRLEHHTLLSTPLPQALQDFFWIWTMKEAYTKALGLGLGFDFARVEYNPKTNVLTVDGTVPTGWAFHKFTSQVGVGEGEEMYVGVVAQHVGGTEPAVVHSEKEACPWIVYEDAVSFVQTCE